MTRANLIRSLALALICATSFGVPQLAASDEVPKFDVSRTCRAESADAPTTRQSCMDDEQSAQEQLSKDWLQFTAADRATCIRTASDISGIRSYVELLTCLQLARDMKNLPKQ